MKRKLFFGSAVSVAIIFAGATANGRGFGGGGFGGGGFHGGGFGGGGFGGGGFGGGGFGGGGFGGGGFGGGGFGGGGFGGGASHGGFGGGGLGGGGLGGGGLGGGGLGGGGLGGGLGGGGLGDRGLGGGGLGGGGLADGLRGSGLGGVGFGGAGGADRLGQGLGDRGPFGGAADRQNAFGGFNRGGFSGAAPSISRLNSFLGMPTDSGLSAASGHDYGMRYAGGASGLSAAAGGEAGYHGGVYHGQGGTTIAHGAAGERGAVVGPGGAAAGERGVSGTVVKGPEGNVYARGEAGERGVVAGPGGVAGGTRVVGGAAVRGPEGNVYARGGSVTRSWSAADLHVNGNYVRANYAHYDAFGRGWWTDHPSAWWGRGFAAGYWTAATWPRINAWFGVDWPAHAYSYGNDITYVNNNVCLYGNPIATQAEYYQSAADLAETGEEADVPSEQPPATASDATAENPADAQWLPLGVFEALQPDQKSSNMTFQIAVNKAGIVRGNYFNSSDNDVKPIEGAVDKQSQRITWVVQGKDKIIFDTGLYNLTKDETTALVHFSADKTQQWTLVRLKQPERSAQASTQQ